MTSIWDIIDTNDIHSLISNTESPDLNAVINHSDLFQLFRENDKELMDFLNNQHVFQNILQIMTKNDDRKLSKRVVELFLFKDSFLLKKLFSDEKTTENLIKSINNTNETQNNDKISLSKEDRLVRIGYISRIFVHSLSITEYKEKIFAMFTKAPETLATLSKHIDITSIFDLLQTYLNLLKPEEQWILFAYLQVLLPKGKSASCPKCFLQYKNFIIIIIKEMATISPLSNEVKLNLLRLISNVLKNSIEVEKNGNSDVINVISTNLASIFNLSESTEEIKVLILQLAMIIPPERSILNIAALLIKNSKPNQFTSVNAAALDLLSASPNKSLAVLLPTIVKNFVNDKSNSFHHLSFLNFITNAIEKVPEMRGPLAKEICPLILSESNGSDSWRKNAQRVGFFLEVATLIDQYVDELAASGTVDKSTFDSWKKFRNSDLKKWKLKDSEKIDAPEAVALPSSASSTTKKQNLAAAVAAEEEASLAKAKSSNSKETVKTVEPTKTTETENSNKKFEFGGDFPSADSFPKEEEKKENSNGGFGGFGFGDGFPPTDSFPKEEKEDDNKGFGGFDNAFLDADSFPKEEEKKENSSGGFGGFGFDNAFPDADSFPKEEDNKKTDNGFGGFATSFPPTDSFPKEEDKKDEGFGGFGNAFPDADSFPKEEEKKENSSGGFGGFGFGDGFPPADSFPKEEDNKKTDNGFGGFDNAFPDADSFPKEEDNKKTDNGFGGFDNAFPDADSFPKEEDNKKTDNGFGGFENAFPDAKDEEKKSDNGFGGFPPVDNFATSKTEDEKDNDSKFGASTAIKDNDEEEAKREVTKSKEDDEEDDDDDSDFEDLSGQPQQTERKIELTKPAPMPVFTQPKPSSDEPVDVSFNHFLELIDNECWTYTGPTPAELFGQKDSFSTAEEAFNFLVGKSK